MRKLLHTGVRRYRKSVSFWIALVASVGIGIMTAPDFFGTVDDVYYMAEWLVLGVLLSLSIAREFGSGGFRNKIIAGYTKGTIFVSEWILAMGVSLLLMICSSLAAIVCGVRLPVEVMQTAESSVVGIVIWLTVGNFLVCLAVASLCVWVSACISLRFLLSSTACIALVLGIFVVGYRIQRSLYQPEYYEEYEYVFDTETGMMTEEKLVGTVKNPAYVDGMARTVLEHTYDLLPGGQVYHYGDILYHFCEDGTLDKEDYAALKWQPVYSLGLLLVSFAGGYLVFRKKDFK